MSKLSTALENLRRFRATFNDGEPVDEESGLSADDLSAIIAAIEHLAEAPEIDRSLTRAHEALGAVASLSSVVTKLVSLTISLPGLRDTDGFGERITELNEAMGEHNKYRDTIIASLQDDVRRWKLFVENIG